MFCPYYKNKEVFDGFNEIVEALGGKPLTEDEFRSSELRNLRTGVDYSAMEAAYRMYHRNNGNMPDIAPNGKHSILFDTLLEHFNGDRAKAIRAKSNVYSDKFINLFGDWISESKVTDGDKIESVEINDHRKIGNDESYQGRLLNTLFDKGASEYNALDILLKYKSFVDGYPYAAYESIVNFLFHDIFLVAHSTGELEEVKIKFYNILYSKRSSSGLAWGLYDYKNGEIVISLDAGEDNILLVFMHELVHALTIYVIYKDNQLRQDLENLINELKHQTIYKNIINEYGLTNPYEFIAEFFSNSDFQGDLYSLPAVKDTNKFKTLFDLVASFILYVLRKIGVLEEENATELEKFSDFYKTSLYYQLLPKMYEILRSGMDYDNVFNGKYIIDTLHPESSNVNSVSKVVDENGEPLIENLGEWSDKSKNIYNLVYDSKEKPLRFKTVDIIQTFGQELGNRLLSGEAVSSRELVLKFGEIDALDFIEGAISRILGRHDIPVKLMDLPNGKLMANFTDSKGQTFIAIDPTLITTVSNKYLATKLSHEMIHALTVNAITKPKTDIERKFSRLNNKLYSIFDKQFPSWKYNRYDKTGRYYILANEKEFAAVFATDLAARNMLYHAAKELDKNQNAVLKLLKSFVNTFSKLIINRDLFKTNELTLKEYENLFSAYLINKDLIYKGNITEQQVHDFVYNNLSNVVLAGDQYAEMRENLNFSLDNFDVNYFVNFEDLSKPSKTNLLNAIDALQKMSDEVVAALKRRIGGLRNSSYLTPAQISKFEETLNIQIKQFLGDVANTFFSVATLLSQLAPQLKHDIDDARKFINPDGSYKSTDAKLYMEQMHNNFGTYLNILNAMEDTFRNGNTASYMILQVLDNPLFLTMSFNKDFLALLRNILVCKQWAEEGVRIMNSVRLLTVKEVLSKIGDETHSPSMQSYLENLEVIGYDTSYFMMQVGSLDGARDDSLRALVYLLNKANASVEKAVNDKSVELLKLQKDLKSGESQLDLYEKNAKGKYTGYLIRALNYGLFYEDYNKFMSDLNLLFGLDVSNRVPPEDFEKRVAWNKAKNKWLSEHCERRFISEYYDILSGLSYEALKARNDIQTNISAIKNKVKHEDGFYYYSELSDDDFNTLLDLYAQKRHLTSEYDINGDLKVDEDLRIARELKALNEKLFPQSDHKPLDKSSKSYKAWKNARLQIIEQCGGIDKYNSKSEDFNWKKLEQWDKRNSKYLLKFGSNGKALLFEKIEEVFNQVTRGGEIIYEVDHDGGKRFEENSEKIKDLLAPYRDRNSGELNPRLIPPAVMAKVRALDLELSKLIRKAKALNPKLRKLSAIKAKIRKQYSKEVPTLLYLDMRKQAMLREAEHPGSLAAFDRNAGRYYVDYDTNETTYELHRWFKKTVPTDKYYNEFMELVPGDGFIDYDENNKYLNTIFSEFSEDEGHYFIPKKSIYENKNFKKIQKSKTLKALYDATLNIMKESNAQYINKPYHDDYLLPQISGSLYTYLKSKEAKWSSVNQIMEDAIKNLGIREEIRSMYGADPTSIFDNYDDFGEVIQDRSSVDVSGKMADNRDLRLIPQFYSTKMQNPETISADLVGILCTYYATAMNYKEKSEIKDVCETIVDQLENRTIITRERGKNGDILKQKSGAESNTYKAAKNFLDMNLYGIRQQKEQIGSVEVSRPGVLLKTFTTAINLGMSISVAAKGFLAGLHAHLMNGLTGYRYDYKDCLNGSSFVTQHLLKNAIGAKYIADKLSNDELMLLAEYFNVAEQGTKKYKHTNRNRFVNAVDDNWCFGMLSTSDFILKTTIMATVLNSYRYYNGEFCTWEDILINNYDKSKEEILKIRESFNKCTKLIDIFKAEDFKLKIKDKKMEAAFRLVEDVVRARCNKTSADADGVATPTQKAAITSYTLGSLLLQHRQYLPKMLENRFGNIVWDMDMQEYVNGQFRVAGNVAKIYTMGAFDIIRGKLKLNFDKTRLGQGLLFGAAAGTLIPLLSPEVGILLGSILGGIGSMSSSDRYDKYMNEDYSNKREYALHLYKNQQIKKTLIEIGMYNLILKPLIGLLCAAADDKLRRKNLILQLAAYIARGAEWELYNPYRFEDILNNIRSAFAATAALDAVGGLSTAISTVSQIYTRESLFNTLLGSLVDLKQYDDTVKSGVYKDWTKGERALLKMTPFHNLYEQLEDPFKKRKYFENKIMKINE